MHFAGACGIFHHLRGWLQRGEFGADTGRGLVGACSSWRDGNRCAAAAKNISESGRNIMFCVRCEGVRKVWAAVDKGFEFVGAYLRME